MGLLSELFKSILHPNEIAAMFQVKFGGFARHEYNEPLDELALTLKDVDFCYATLNKVSRSFAVVIQQLPEELKDPVCIFYLVLRGLDSVEDDMTFNNSAKIPLLQTFHEKLYQDGWNIENVGDSQDYRILLAHFEKVIRVFKGLKPEYRTAIADICRRMGAGMAEFAEKKTVATVTEYNLYCHYVAGLVGYGLSDLFMASGLEDASLAEEHKISNSMGLFLQKTNIIRDYLEDLREGRIWWPREIWSQYAPSLDWFSKNPTAPESLACLNHMVTDALELVPDCLQYLARIRNPLIFRFCAIPQVMAIATLAAVYNNYRVFTSVVKIRKGLSCKMMLHTNNMNAVSDRFRSVASEIANSIPTYDPNYERTYQLTSQIRQITQVQLPRGMLKLFSIIAWITFFAAFVYLISRYRSRKLSGFVFRHFETEDIVAVVGGFFSIAFILGFFGVQYV